MAQHARAQGSHIIVHDLSPKSLALIAKFVFWAALLFTLACASLPPDLVPQLVPWDKAEHFIAFYTLTALALAAFPRHSLLRIAVLLSIFGAVIELVQALPFIHRDCDFWDWSADTIAIAATLAPLALVPLRTYLRGA
jgi:hypothetical protein